MKQIIFVLLICMCPMSVSAQEVYNSSGRPGYHKNTKKQKGYDPSKLVFGGGIILDFADGYATYGISPIIGYHITKQLVAGVGLGYMYNQQPDPNPVFYNPPYIEKYDIENIVYPSVWAKYFVWRGLYVCGTFEYDITNLTYPNFDNTGSYMVTDKMSVTSECLLLGLGVKFSIGGRASFFVELNDDILQQQYSPYFGEPLIYRAGIAFGL